MVIVHSLLYHPLLYDTKCETKQLSGMTDKKKEEKKD